MKFTNMLCVLNKCSTCLFHDFWDNLCQMLRYAHTGTQLNAMAKHTNVVLQCLIKDDKHALHYHSCVMVSLTVKGYFFSKGQNEEPVFLWWSHSFIGM